jgi:hypothetical protein
LFISETTVLHHGSGAELRRQVMRRSDSIQKYLENKPNLSRPRDSRRAE